MKFDIIDENRVKLIVNKKELDFLFSASARLKPDGIHITESEKQAIRATILDADHELFLYNQGEECERTI